MAADSSNESLSLIFISLTPPPPTFPSPFLISNHFSSFFFFFFFFFSFKWKGLSTLFKGVGLCGITVVIDQLLGSLGWTASKRFTLFKPLRFSGGLFFFFFFFELSLYFYSYLIFFFFSPPFPFLFLFPLFSSPFPLAPSLLPFHPPFLSSFLFQPPLSFSSSSLLPFPLSTSPSLSLPFPIPPPLFPFPFYLPPSPPPPNRLFNNVEPPSRLYPGYDYHFFETGIKPAWEDIRNKKGGKWTVVLNSKKKDSLDKYWLNSVSFSFYFLFVFCFFFCCCCCCFFLLLLLLFLVPSSWKFVDGGLGFLWNKWPFGKRGNTFWFSFLFRFTDGFLFSCWPSLVNLSLTMNKLLGWW